MSVDEETIKAGSPQASSASSLQLSDCTGGYANISAIVEDTVATPDFAAACPFPDSAASPKHTSTMDALTPEPVMQRARGNDNNINRRNSVHPSKQQQARVTKRRNTSSFSFKHPTSGKRRRRANSESDSVLPTNFLLGGNIFDPLNLNSLLDEEVNKALNAETPKSSPLPAKSRDPVEILIPRDITDPLNLNSGIADGSVLVSPYKSGGKKRHRNRHHAGNSILAPQHILPDLRGNEARSGSCTQHGDALPSSAQNVSLGDSSHEHLTDYTLSCKEEMSVEKLSSSLTGTNQHTSKRKRRRNSGKIDPPVTHSTPVLKSVRDGGTGTSQSFSTPKCGAKSSQGGRPHQQPQRQRKTFQYGNYNKYYGYRNPGAIEDLRIQVFKPEWFKGKDVLDLGCNAGHLTLYIAKMFQPARILGLDIDGDLVYGARKNIRHYLSELQTEEARREVQEKGSIKTEGRDGEQSHTATENSHNEAVGKPENGQLGRAESGPAEAVKDNDSHTSAAGSQRQEPPAGQSVNSTFPVSLRISRGPIAAPPLTEVTSAPPGHFPSNVSFVKANYVLENDHLLVTQRPEYDVILCLSVTKWVHLNWGDNGLKRLFKRAFKHLRPGGIFILEPQPWESYGRRKKVTEIANRNYRNICLKPEQFTFYLTSEVGFTSYEYLGAPKSAFKGFQRPIYLFHK
ncbi:7SK snRNA methylphosphate capping enzyme [Eucyclogobius newberryi]|uniref:7SK snRNA methylphosphate capping enzyme n=1 Tax=Eucyclogobius newberryi TaxID=166745 RepID=UPI003B5B7AA8